MIKHISIGRSSVSAAALAIATLTCAPAAWAQDTTAPAGEAANATADQEIIVTGSRLGRTSFNSPTPVNVVGEQRMQDLNVSNVGDALNQIPSFRPLTNPSTNSFRAGQNIGGRNLDLRGLGPTRTLTLVDGHRHVASGDDARFDLNSIPSILVQRSEVVTGGASAAYGADAVAGVVNLILDTKLNGIKSDLSYGISERGDARNIYGALAAGTGFAGGRGHVIFGLEYSHEGPVQDVNARKWSARYRNFIPNPYFSTNPALSNGLPANIAIDNVLFVLNPAGLVSVVNPLQGTQFDSNGNLIPFQFGDLFRRDKPSTFMVGGDPSVQDVYGVNNVSLVVGGHHISTLGHVDYDVTDSITASAELSYARVVGGPARGSDNTSYSGEIQIKRDNAYLTPGTAAMMDAAGITVLPVSRSNPELGHAEYISRNKTWNGSFSLKGDLFSDWKWDASYQYGKTTGRVDSNHNIRVNPLWFQSLDAVFAPAGVAGIAPGTIICRSTIADPTNGCLPANVMGPGKISPAVAQQVTTNVWQTRKYTLNEFAANLRGTVLNGWAGPISAAVGVEHRIETAVGTNDPATAAGITQGSAMTALPRTRQKVTEGYLEVNVPIFKDSAIGKSLEIDGAIRRTHYSTAGNATTWKVGGAYEINDEYMVRVTRSRDIRAPTPEELNPNQAITLLPLTDTKYGIQYNIPSYTGGNPGLNLEKADTFTAGIVLQPHWLPRFKLSVDYYDIKVKGAIDKLSPVLAVPLCRGTAPEVCEIGTDSLGNPDRILKLFSTYQNVSQLNARGVEVVADYTLDLADLSASLGKLNFQVNGSYVDRLSTTDAGGNVVRFDDVTGNSGSVTSILGVPKWRVDEVITYSKPTYSISAHLKYIPNSLLNRNWIGPDDPNYSPYLPNSVTNNRIGARFYLDLAARVKLFGEGDHKVEVYGGINNVFDREPPYNLRLIGNGLYFDPIGRAYKLGIRTNW